MTAPASLTPERVRELTKPKNGVAAECRTCRWRYADGRCHVNPPTPLSPYGNSASWPIVPPAGGGCSLHAE